MLAPRIQVYDVDQTTISGGTEDVFDIAFVPGFTRKYFGDVIERNSTTLPTNGEGEELPQSHPDNGGFVYYTSLEKKYEFTYELKPSYIGESAEIDGLSSALLYSGYAPALGTGTAGDDFLVVAEYNGSIGLYKRKRKPNVVTINTGVTPHTVVYELWDGTDPAPTSNYYQELPDSDNVQSVVLHTFESGEEVSVITYTTASPVQFSPSAYTYARPIIEGGERIGWTCGEFEAAEIQQYPTSEYVSSAHFGYLGYTYGNAVEHEEGYTTYSIYKDVATGNYLYQWKYEEKTWDGLSIDNITRCNSVSEFKNQFGSEPISVWNHTWGKNTKNTEKSVKPPFEFAKKESGKTTNVEIQQWINNNNLQSEIVWVDKGWLYACELLMNGIPVYYHATDITEDEIKDASDVDTTMRNAFFGITDGTVDNHNFRDIYKQLADKGEYNVKYITTGAFGIDLDIKSDTNIVANIVTINTNADDAEFEYPFYDDGQGTVTRGLVEYLVDIANYRKDCLVLVDGLQDDNELLPDNKNSVYYKLDARVQENAFVNYNSEDSMTMDDDDKARSGRRGYNTFPWYKAVMLSFPNAWRQYRPVDKNVFIMPGSFAYLSCLATSIQKYESASWEAIAGVTRALVPNFVSLYVNDRLTNAVADAYNKRNATGINAITNIRPYGYCIWGNRTLVNNAHFAKQGDTEDGLVASSFVDIMSMVCNVNKVAYRACKRLMFEKNNEVLWVRFLQAVSPYLDQLVTGGAIENYEIQREESTMRGQLVAKIVIWPVYSVENFDIAIVLRDQETTVES